MAVRDESLERPSKWTRRHALKMLGAGVAFGAIVGCEASELTVAGGEDSGTDSDAATGADASATDAITGSATAWATGGTASMTAKASYPDPFTSAVTTCTLLTTTTEGPCTTATDLVFEVARSGGFEKTGYRYHHAYSAADGDIINYGEENDSARLYFNADFAFAWTWKQVFIDNDSSASTGYQIGDAGCEWLIENDDLYKYTGNGTTWSWSSEILEADGSAAAHHTVDGTVHEWWVWRNTVDEQRFDKDNNRLILRGHTGPPLYETPMYDFETSP